MMRSRLAVVSLCLLSACFDEAELTDEELAFDEEELFVSSKKIWQQLAIPVCWENGVAGNATERGWVKAKIEATWETASRVDFTGWGACPAVSTGVRISIQDVNPVTIGQGKELAGAPGGMILNFTFNNYSKAVCQASAAARKMCIEGVAVHEFGHALGIQHEHLRSDNPAGCVQPPGGPAGDTNVGPYDPSSVMNYCNSNWINGVLSAGDIAGVRQYYGSSTFDGNRKAAIAWPNGKIYFFNGSEYTRYTLASGKADSGYPKPIAGNWTGWPAAWASGVDAAVNWGNGKVYFFRGSQYLRFDVATDKVDQAPKAIAGNWPGWPAAFTGVDAVVNWGNGKAYFFRGSQYLRYSITLDKVDQAPKAIAGNWPGLFTSNIDYSVTPGNGKTYFFKGLQYAQYNMAADTVDTGFPLGIVGRWPGVPF